MCRVTRSFCIVLGLLLLFLKVPEASAGEWELIGFPDKPVVAIGVHPSDPQVLYAFVRDTSHWTFLYKSVDDGCTWDSLLYIFAGEGIVIDPICPGTVYAYGDTVLLKSTNNGATWEDIKGQFYLGPEGGHEIYYFTLNFTNPSIL